MQTNTHNLIDALSGCKQITPRTRKAVVWSINAARDYSHDYPTLPDIAEACVGTGAEIDTVAAALGYVRAHDNYGDPDADPYYDVRYTWIEDNRRGVVPSMEALLALTLFTLTTGIEIPFPFTVGKATARPSKAGQASCADARASAAV